MPGNGVLSENPLASTIFWAWSMMFDMSTCVRSLAPCSLEPQESATYSDDLLRSSLGGEHAEDSSSASNIEDDLVPA